MGVGTEGGLPPISDVEKDALLSELLRGVSRAFYLTIRVLPRRLREPIGLAYLLARAADTIADTSMLPSNERLKHLLAFRGQVEGAASLDALREISGSLTDMQAIPDERVLLESLPKVFALLESLSVTDQGHVRSVVATLTRGMEIDLGTFPSEDSGDVAAFRDWAELDNYTYYVAGCVGEFWTAVTMEHTPSLGNWDVTHMSEVGVRFGKALQMTNVLRDVPKDLRLGRCYLPQDELLAAGLSPGDLLDSANDAKARAVLVEGIRKTLEHYVAAEEYLLAIPRRHLRLRLAVLWPILIGLGTLERLALNEGWLDLEMPSKVSRGWVYRMLVLSLLSGRSNGALHWWIGRLRKRVGKAIQV